MSPVWPLTMAEGEEADRRTDKTRCVQAASDPDGVKQEGLLASCEDRSDQRGLVQYLSHEAGVYVNENTVDQDSPR